MNRLVWVCKALMAFVYILMGIILIFFVKNRGLIDTDTIRFVFGSVLILYGFYRTYQSILVYKQKFM